MPAEEATVESLGGVNDISRWWQLKHLLFSSLPGEMTHFDEHIFQMGWFNHQLVSFSVFRFLVPSNSCLLVGDESTSVLQGFETEVFFSERPHPKR